MPVIRRSFYQARKEYRCDDCNQKISIGDFYIYLYGMAHYGEKPYPLHICQLCDYENSQIANYEGKPNV